MCVRSRGLHSGSAITADRTGRHAVQHAWHTAGRQNENESVRSSGKRQGKKVGVAGSARMMRIKGEMTGRNGKA